MKKWLQEFLLLLHLTGDSNFRSHQNRSPWKIIVLDVCLCNLCVQLWWGAHQADAACLDDTTFTPLMGFYMSSLETAATCWLETASIEPSHCWVTLTDDGLWYEMYQLILSVTGCRRAVRSMLDMHVFWRILSPFIFFSPPFATLESRCMVNVLPVSPTGDLVDGKRTGVTLFLGDAFELHLSVDGQLSQGDKRLHICGGGMGG